MADLPHQVTTSAANAKQQHELRVFREFANAAALPLGLEMPKVCAPPEPDILVQLNGEPCYFELGRLADDDFAKFVLKVESSTTPLAANLGQIGYPPRDMLLQKLGKTYDSSGRRIELVLYYDTDAAHLAGPIPPCPFSLEAEHVMEPIVRKSMGPFSRVWYFERYRRTVLWHWPANGSAGG